MNVIYNHFIILAQELDYFNINLFISLTFYEIIISLIRLKTLKQNSFINRKIQENAVKYHQYFQKRTLKVVASRKSMLISLNTDLQT